MRQANNPVQDEIREQEIEDELEGEPEDFLDEAMADGEDMTVLPVCINDFDNLYENSRLVPEKMYGALLNEDKPAFFPTNKKLYDENLHQNSEEFKQLGTLHQENRTAAYYPPE